jgi:hypothetical protein
MLQKFFVRSDSVRVLPRSMYRHYLEGGFSAPVFETAEEAELYLESLQLKAKKINAVYSFGYKHLSVYSPDGKLMIRKYLKNHDILR